MIWKDVGGSRSFFGDPMWFWRVSGIPDDLAVFYGIWRILGELGDFWEFLEAYSEYWGKPRFWGDPGNVLFWSKRFFVLGLDTRTSHISDNDAARTHSTFD